MLSGVLWGLALAHGAEWRVLQEEQVRVRCLGGVSCEAEAWLAMPPVEVLAVLAKVEAYPSMFASVKDVSATGADTYAVVGDLPFPFADFHTEVEVSTREGLVSIVVLDGRCPLWSRAEWSMVAEGEGTRLTWRWSGMRSMPSWIWDKVQVAVGHRMLWGVAGQRQLVPRLTPD